MQNSSNPNHGPSSKLKPVPAASPSSKLGGDAASSTSQSQDGLTANPQQSQRPAGGETLARIAEGAHRAVDATVAQVAPVVDAVHDKAEAAKRGAQSIASAASKLQDSGTDVKNTAAEWIGTARETVRAHPLVAIAGALLIGAACGHLTSKR